LKEKKKEIVFHINESMVKNNKRKLIDEELFFYFRRLFIQVTVKIVYFLY